MYQHIGSEGHCVHSHCTVLYRWDLHHQWTACCMELFFQQVIVYCTLVLYLICMTEESKKLYEGFWY